MTPDPEFLHQLGTARDAINAALNRAAGLEVLAGNRERLAAAPETPEHEHTDECFQQPGEDRFTWAARFTRHVRTAAPSTPTHGPWCVQDSDHDSAGPFVHGPACHDGSGTSSESAAPSTPDGGLREYMDQLEPPVPVGYGDDPKQTFEAGFGWALDAITDYLDGTPWKGGHPPVTHGPDGKPLAAAHPQDPPETRRTP